MKEIYYFSSSLSPLNDYWILKELLANNIEVKVINIYDLINDSSKDIAVKNAQVEYYRVCRSSNELESVLASIVKGNIAFAPTGGGVSQEIRYKLAEKGVSVVCDTTFSLPIVPLSTDMSNNAHYSNPIQKVLRVFQTKGAVGFIRHCVDFIKSRLPVRISVKINKRRTINLNKIRENTYLVTSGAKNHLAYRLISDAYNQIKIGHFSTVCRESKLRRVVDGSYWVFIDQALPFHRDSKRVGINYEHFADDYYHSLVSYFNYIEESTNKKVVVALHPRTEETYAEYFTGYDTFKGLTEELIEYSEGIISHFSTCIYSAVYLKKPVIIVTNRLMDMHHDVRRMHDFSQRLKIPIIDIDKQYPLDFESHIDVDKVAYQRFTENYIKQSDAKDDTAVNILREKFGF
ncbi:hypothetical protein JCM19240_683 [Vibrio maritimus]|uniref:Uncharacterized protein n=1 Tax=Vibrio maritimus TaxID=990268 RepID=A0A090TCC3_9VIBR|nr:hypothetical protein JCM19240_683 [Vibrio maritimus]